MEVTVAVAAEGATVVSVAGQLDLDTADVLRTALERALAAPVARIVVDLSAVTFCDSIGLSVFATTHNACTTRGGYLRLAAPNPFVRRILTIVGLADHIPVFDTAADATT
jgi:anti-anti-sigma factor